MKFHRIYSSFLVTLLCAVTAYAQSGDKGNGGNAVVCFANTSKGAKIVESIMSKPEAERNIPNKAIKRIVSVKLLDLFEVGDRSDMNLTEKVETPLFEPLTGESNADYIERSARRFKESSPYFYSLLRDGFAAFDGKITIRDGLKGVAGISQVQDYGKLKFEIDRTHCVIATIANQSAEGKLEIDGRLYLHRKHSEMSQKALIVHEILFRKAIPDHLDAPTVRKLTTLLIQKTVNRNDLIKMYYLLGFRQGVESDPEVYKSLYGEFSANQELSSAFDDFVAANATKTTGTVADVQVKYDIDLYMMTLVHNKERDVLQAELDKEKQKHSMSVTVLLLQKRIEALDRKHNKAVEALDLRTKSELFKAARLEEKARKLAQIYARMSTQTSEEETFNVLLKMLSNRKASPNWLDLPPVR